MKNTPTAEAKSALCDLLSLCMEISDTTKADCFFRYSPHCASYSVDYFPAGLKAGADSYICLNFLSDITVENVEQTLAALNRFYSELRKEKTE